MIRFVHPIRALSAAAIALLLVAAPLVVRGADEEPTPLNPLQAKPVPSSTTVGPPAEGAASPIGSVISPGDHLAISVYGDPSLSTNAVVQSDGTIQYGLVGRVAVAGQTPAQAQETLTKALGRYLKHPAVSVAIMQQGVYNILVMGNVKQSGRYTVRSNAHISEAIAAAGGVAQANGGFPTARVLESDGKLVTADLQKLFREGDASQNVTLTNDATIYVLGAETLRVTVTGAVTRPGNVEVFEGDRLDMAIARAGAEAQAKPNLNAIYLTRHDPTTGKTVSYQLDLYKALKGGDMRYDPILQKDDKIYVPEVRQMSQTTLGIIGILGHFLGL